MSALVTRIEVELKAAMLAKAAVRRDALRLILSSLRSAEKELQRPLSTDEELLVLQLGHSFEALLKGSLLRE